MNKHILSVLLLLILLMPTVGQTTARKDGLEFDTKDFAAKSEIAEWLVRYDYIAWITTDHLMEQGEKELERLGQEWFCFEDENGLWNAVYGKLAEGKYEVIFHFVIGKDGKIIDGDKKTNSKFLDSHAQAVSTAREKLAATIPKGSPRFNQYIKQNPDKTFSVWMLPAFQPNGMAVFGGEGIYTIDESGKKILKDDSYFQKEFRGFMAKPPREIWLDYREVEKPTLGSVFFVLYYRSYFTKIFIANSKSTSTMVKDGDNYMWLNIEKDPDTATERPAN